MTIIYHIGVLLYGWIIRLSMPFYKKARLFHVGRRGLMHRLSMALKNNTYPVVWLHAASYGEFQQAIPIVEALKSYKKKVFVLLTFFSPSGFENAKGYQHADYMCYLPLDTPGNSIQFVHIVKPKLVVFIKYEFWYNYLKSLRKASIPVFVASAVFRNSQWFFHPTGHFLLNELKSIDHFFVQDRSSMLLLKKHDINQVSLTGDSRFDRVFEVASRPQKLVQIERFRGNENMFVFGSIWSSDFEKLKSFILEKLHDIKIVLVPHELNKSFIDSLLRLPYAVRWSEVEEVDTKEYRVMVIDTIGILAQTYKYAKYAYVGGGFKGALHNVLEPAAYGCPVFFGEHSKNAKFIESNELVKSGAGFSFYDTNDFKRKFDELESNKSTYDAVYYAAKTFVQERCGATEIILEKLKSLV